MEVQGKFSAQRFYETLARIISQKENVAVTVKVTRKTESKKREDGRKTA